MKKNAVNPYFSHQETLLVLPWYVNNTLRDPEMKAVEAHLKVCLICKREIATLQKLSLAVSQADDLESQAHASFSRLKNRIHQTAEPVLPKNTESTRQHKWYQKLGLDYFSFPQPTFAMASLLLLSVLIPGVYVADKMQQSDFRTLSSSENLVINSNEIRVIFMGDTPQQQKNTILDSVHGEIVDGPTTEGVYLIRIPPKPEAGAILDALSSLRKNEKVIFAEPAYALLSTTKHGGDSK